MALNTQSEPLSLEHQSLLISLLRPLCLSQNLKFAEYTFTNMFLTRKKHNYKFVSGEQPVILGEFKPNNYYIIPTSTPDKINLKIPDDCIFFPIPEEWTSFFKKNHFNLTFDRADSDYLFHIAKLKTLKGRNLSSRRNLLHQLESRYNLQSKDITNNTIADAENLLNQWQIDSKQTKEMTDFFACQDALQYFEQLALFGRIVYADGKPIGFTIGKLITPQTALLHFSKFRHDFKGVTPYLYRDFANHLPETVQWINLMQDLGISSLRQAKEAYQPDELLTKWRATNQLFE